jgi:hypothetical protein
MVPKLVVPGSEGIRDLPKRQTQWLGYRVFGIILLQHL